MNLVLRRKGFWLDIGVLSQYVYDYESGKKGSNCGFIKVEVKDQQCSVEIHLHCPGLPENVKCNIYGFTRKDGLINGILLDTCETEKEL